MNDPKHPISLLAQPSMQLLLAVVGGLLLGWPVIQIAGERGQWVLYFFVFMVWAVLILMLAFVGRAITRSARAPDSTTGPDIH